MQETYVVLYDPILSKYGLVVSWDGVRLTPVKRSEFQCDGYTGQVMQSSFKDRTLYRNRDTVWVTMNWVE